MSKIDKPTLDRVVKHYLSNKDRPTAENIIRSWGPHIKGYDIESELKKLDENPKPKNKNLMEEKI